MGNSHIKDNSVQIFLQLDKQFYIAGDYVEGQVYLRMAQSAQPQPYTQLVLGIHGEEYVYWSEGSGNSRRTYRNRYNNYNSFFVILDVGGKGNQMGNQMGGMGTMRGDFVIPFKFLLPSMITGSFFYSKHCFLKYMIKAELIHASQPRKNQFYQQFLNLLQPPRMPIGPISLTNSVNSKCCHCCSSYGTTVVTMNTDRNFVMNGDLIQINGLVDNSHGTQIIKSSTVNFERRKIMVSSGGHVRDVVLEEFQFHRMGPVQPHSTGNFSITAKIPESLLQCTAIGRITAMYYLLRLKTNYGCCANKAQAKAHIIFHSRTPMIVKTQPLPQPPNWYPQGMQKVQFTGMSPYMYLPDPKIPFTNLPQNQVTMNESQPSLYPNMPPNQGFMSERDEQNSSHNMTANKNWSQNHSYQPVFYDQQMISDAQRQYLLEKQEGNGSGSGNTQNNIYKKL